MNSKRNKKLCFNCEGEIDKDALYCLYCGADLNVGNMENEVPQPLYRARAPEVQEEVLEAVVPATKEKNDFLSMLLMIPGAVFLVFSLFMLFVSNGETLTLKWDASYWFVYLLASFPLLFLGYRLNKD